MKIDHAAIAHGAGDDVGETLLRSLHQINKVLGKSTIIQGVSSAELLKRLAAAKVDYAQGAGGCAAGAARGDAPARLKRVRQRPQRAIVSSFQRTRSRPTACCLFPRRASATRIPSCEFCAAPSRAPASVLEIGSGTGQHAVHFARHLPQLRWQPSDTAEHLDALRARIIAEGTPNLRRAAAPRCARSPLADQRRRRAYSAPTPCTSCPGRRYGSSSAAWAGLLGPGGVLGVYGPFRYAGRYTSESNAAFDRYLQERDPASGNPRLRGGRWRSRARRGLSLTVIMTCQPTTALLVWRRP